MSVLGPTKLSQDVPQGLWTPLLITPYKHPLFAYFYWRFFLKGAQRGFFSEVDKIYIPLREFNPQLHLRDWWVRFYERKRNLLRTHPHGGGATQNVAGPLNTPLTLELGEISVEDELLGSGIIVPLRYVPTGQQRDYVHMICTDHRLRYMDTHLAYYVWTMPYTYSVKK